MKGHGAKFPKKQEEALVALLTHRSVEEAARSLEIATTTLMRWLQEPEFQTGYKEARRAAFSHAIARLQQASATAATVLLRVMVDPASPTSSKVRAAESVLDRAAKAIEIEDIEARVTELERAAKSENK